MRENETVTRPVPRDELVSQLRDLGVAPGAVVVVHAAFSRVRPVEGGPEGLIEALQAAVGPAGTLVMPSFADTDDEVFRVDASPCRHMGILAETFRRLPGVLRSDSPHAFAARGPRAAEITRPHPLEAPHGVDSPVGRVHALDGQVLLLGVGHDADTTIHLAENIARVRYRRPIYSTVMTLEGPRRVDYFEPDHCCQRFALLDDWLDARAAQRSGRIGSAEARLAASREIVAAALEGLRAYDTVFLHPAGQCRECDEARGSIRSQEA